MKPSSIALGIIFFSLDELNIEEEYKELENFISQ